jgi:hypothetical protein
MRDVGKVVPAPWWWEKVRACRHHLRAPVTRSMAAHDALPQDWLLLRGLGREAGHWEPFPEVRCAHARTML